MEQHGAKSVIERITSDGKTYSLVDLLATNVMQPAVQITNALHNILHLILVLCLNLARLANGNVQSHPDGALGIGQPAAGGGVGVSREAKTVLAGVGGRESKAAGVALALGYDAVVVVEGLVNGDEHLQVRVDCVAVGVWVDDLSLELACS